MSMRILPITLISLFLSSCAMLPNSVTERNIVTELSIPENYQAEENANSQIIKGLFDVFQDEKLEGLVNQSLSKNLDLQLAAKQMEEAGFNASAEWGNLLPNITGNANGSRAQGAQGNPANNYSPSLDVSWEIDIWGKLRNQKNAADAIALAQAENYQAIRDSIAAQIMQGWFDVVTAKRQVELDESRLENLEKSLHNSARSYKAGLGDLDDLDAVNRDIAQTKATLSASNSSHNNAVRNLQILMGDYPSGEIDEAYHLPELIAPPKADIPANILTERPDLRSAWQEVISADESVKVAHKAMFPSLSLTGSLGAQSSQFSDIMSGATIWSIAENLALPIFNAGKLENNMNVTQSRAEQAWIRYLQTALKAFFEVEQGLDKETLLADQEREQQQAVYHAQNTLHIFEERYKNGLVSILEYLNAQNTVFNMKGELLRIRNERLKNRVALALALGKGV